MFPKAPKIYCSMGHSGGFTFSNVINLVEENIIEPEIAISDSIPIDKW